MYIYVQSILFPKKGTLFRFQIIFGQSLMNKVLYRFLELLCYLDICGHLSGQVLDLWVKVKVKGQVDLWGHKVGHGDL